MSLEVGSTLEITTVRLARGGRAVGHTADGFVVFVAGAAPDETVRAEITKVAARFAEARTIDVLTPSPHRVTPPCAVADRCGGCPWQHVEYAEQVRQKDAILREALKRSGGLAEVELATVAPFLASPEPFRYRSRITVHVREGEVGFLQRESHTFVAIDDCLIADQALVPYAKSLVKARESRFQVGRDQQGELFAGGAFTQVNRAQNARLQALVAEQIAAHVARLPDVGHWHVLDLYCGNGNLTFPVVERLRADRPEAVIEATGVELSRESVAEAKQNPRSQLCRFEQSDVETWLARQKAGFEPRFAKKNRLQAAEIAVLDPPRAGCEKGVLPLLARRKPSLIVMVSCDPATLARDLQRLKITSGPHSAYELIFAQGLDMFPQTDHLETVAVLSRKETAGTS